MKCNIWNKQAGRLNNAVCCYFLGSFIFKKRRISRSIMNISVFVFKDFLLIKHGQIITEQYQFLCTGFLKQFQSR